MSDVTLSGFLRQVRSGCEDQEASRFGDLSAVVADGLAVFLESAAETEFEARIGARRYERGASDRSDYRNGTRTRTVQTPYATFAISLPRMRGQGFVPEYLERNHRAVAEVADFVRVGLLNGLSRVQIERQMESSCGVRPSQSVLDRVQKGLDDQAKAFKERVLTDDYEYLFLDAAWVKDIVGISAVRVCIMTAVGITTSGRKEVLGFERSRVENESGWRGFLQRLKDRGLRATTLRLVISDEHKGLVNAVAEVLGNVAHQLCWAHRMRNVVERVAKADRKAIVEGLRAIYRAEHRKGAVVAWAKFRTQWIEQYGSVVQSLEEDLANLLSFFDAPPLHRQYVRTSNPIERVFRDLRKRGFGCGAFANRQACDRIMFSVYTLLNKLWRDKDIWRARQIAAVALARRRGPEA
jgi:transposase-like protein